MNPATPPSPVSHRGARPPPPREQGFALLITITLVAFLVLLLVALATLTRVETQVADNSQRQAKARQNALMALNIAIGQLQKNTGPDQRVTATADLQPLVAGTVTDPASGIALNGSPTSSILTAIDTYWRGGRNRHWVGAWRNANNDPNDFDADNPSAFNPVPELQAWLVSGNEETGNTFLPQTAIPGLTLAALNATGAASAKFGDPTSPFRLLVGPGTVALSTPDDLDRAVLVPEVAIEADAAGYATPVTVGHYAWWVGDEGVKARANLSDPYATPSATTEDQRTRLQSAQRPAIEVITSNGVEAFARLAPETQPDPAEFKTRLTNVLTAGQLAYLAPTETSFPAELRARYHDYTIHSRGVLSDPRHGGLKVDLTYLFAREDAADYRAALRAAFNTSTLATDSDHNRLFTPEATPYATFPSNDGSYHAGTWPYEDGGTRAGIFTYGTTWEQLRSFATMGNRTTDTPAGVFNGSGEAVPRLQTATDQGIVPLVIQAKLFYRLRIVGGATDGDGVNRTGLIAVDTIPQVVLANPYAVALAPADYHFDFSGSQGALVYGSTDDPSDPPTNWDNRFYTTEPSYIGNPTFVLRTTGMAPGEAQIFTIDADSSSNPTITSTGAYDLIPVSGSSHTQNVVMKNDLDLLTGMTFNTGRSIPASATRVAFRGYTPQINTHLYLDRTAADGDRKLIQFIRGQQYTAETGTSFLLVNPLAQGTRQGGGHILVLNQAPVNTAMGSGYTSSSTSVPQQAPFYQTNYRAAYVFWAGSDSTSGTQHVLEWARTFAKNGDTGLPGDTPNPWLAANLMRPSGSLTTTRWGLFNVGEGQEQTSVPSYIDPTSEIGLRNLLYDIPRPGRPLASLGQLQHFNTLGFIDTTSVNGSADRQAYVLNSWQNNYAVANSYPHSRVPRDQVFFRRGEMGRHYDGSYLWNDLLWDRFYFSTYPQIGDEFDFGDPADRLVNSRHRPFRSPAETAWDDAENFRGDGDPTNPVNPRVAAANLLVDGAFNINSTSVEAWRAVFSSLRNVPVAGDTSTVAPVSRTLYPLSDSTNADQGNTPAAWNGFYDFTTVDIDALAEEMVLQIRRRGPFTSLGEFVNRRLAGGRTSNGATAADTLRLGLSGPLQAALDAVVNQRTELAAPFDVQAKPFVSLGSGNSLHNVMADADYRLPSGLAGIPGYVLQADVLTPLAPTLAARSDTFVIRTYGDTTNPADGEVLARAWLEAVVQRLPDYHETTLPATELPVVGSDNATFGRRYQIVSLRWLTPEDL